MTLPKQCESRLSDEKAIRLGRYEDFDDGNYDIVFKSAKYNHVRTEVNVETMEKTGARRKPHEGEEEKTHLCIRFNGHNKRFLAVHESNHYGISISMIVNYLNEKLKLYNEQVMIEHHYKFSYQIVPGDDFLTEIKKAKYITLLKVTVCKDEVKDSFLKFAGRSDIPETIDISIKRPKDCKNFPQDLIKEYYNDMQQDNKIYEIFAEVERQHGKFSANTNLIKMKQFIDVELTPITKEVDSPDFFKKAQNFINEKKVKMMSILVLVTPVFDYLTTRKCLWKKFIIPLFHLYLF
jgi:hypothetical protein